MLYSKNSVHRITLTYNELALIDDSDNAQILERFTIEAGVNGATLYTSEIEDFLALIDAYDQSTPKSDEDE